MAVRVADDADEHFNMPNRYEILVVGQFEKCSGGSPQPLEISIEKTAEDSRRYITE